MDGGSFVNVAGRRSGTAARAERGLRRASSRTRRGKAGEEGIGGRWPATGDTAAVTAMTTSSTAGHGGAASACAETGRGNVVVVASTTKRLTTTARARRLSTSTSTSPPTIAILYDHHSPPDKVLRVAELPPAEIGDRDVCVRMLAAPINPSDLNHVEGVYPVCPPLPTAVAGYEGVGQAHALGAAFVSPLLSPGDWVIPSLPSLGTWQTYIVNPATAWHRVFSDVPPPIRRHHHRQSTHLAPDAPRLDAAMLDAAMALADMAGAAAGKHEASPPPHAMQETAAKGEQEDEAESRRWRARG
uniref:Alcohol dehydrogenase-like N-terminal domain-containing protein n=1 Tax=Oryza meridionalis TaxID=40149 RepID=A0A0E0CMF5_9ORYZ